MRDQSAPLLRTMLYISGELFNLDELSSILDFPPTETGTKGTIKANGKTKHNETFWKYSKDIYAYSVSDAIREILDTVVPFRSALTSYVKDKNLEISFICNVTIREDRPIYQLEKEVIQIMACFNAEFLMDIFDYSE